MKNEREGKKSERSWGKVEEGARRIGKSRKYALERSVSFAISGVCIRLDAHQVVHEFRKGESGARRYGSLRSQRDVAARFAGTHESRQARVNEAAEKRTIMNLEKERKYRSPQLRLMVAVACHLFNSLVSSCSTRVV